MRPRSLSGLSKTGFVMAALFSVLVGPACSGAWADPLTREEILQQHQQLARQQNVSFEAGENGTGPLAPPLSPVGPSSAGREAEPYVAPLPDDGPVSSAPLSSSSTVSNISSRPIDAASADGGGDLMARLLERVSALEGQTRQMRGEIDSLTNRLAQDEANTEKQFGDLKFALQNGGAGQNGSAARTGTAITAPSGKNLSKNQPGTAAEALIACQAALKARHYSEAETLARQAMATAHSSSGKIEAHYYLANALAGQKQYRQSAVAYYDIYSKSPKSNYAPEALLGLASSMAAAGSKPAACEALGKLAKEYPAQAAHLSAPVKSVRQRAACH